MLKWSETDIIKYIKRRYRFESIQRSSAAYDIYAIYIIIKCLI